MGLADGMGIGQMFWSPCEILWKYLEVSLEVKCEDENPGN